MKGVLKRGFEDALGITTVRGALTNSEDMLASHLVERHRSRDWVYRMDDKRWKRLGRE